MIEKIDDDHFFKSHFNQEKMGQIPTEVLPDLEKQWPPFLPRLNPSILKRFAEIVTSAGFETTNPNESEYQNLDLAESLQKNLIRKAPGAKLSYLKTEESLLLYVDGNTYTLALKNLVLAELLCDHLEVNCSALIPLMQEQENQNLIRKLLSTSSLELLSEQS